MIVKKYIGTSVLISGSMHTITEKSEPLLRLKGLSKYYKDDIKADKEPRKEDSAKPKRAKKES